MAGAGAFRGGGESRRGRGGSSTRDSYAGARAAGGCSERRVSAARLRVLRSWVDYGLLQFSKGGSHEVQETPPV